MADHNKKVELEVGAKLDSSYRRTMDTVSKEAKKHQTTGQKSQKLSKKSSSELIKHQKDLQKELKGINKLISQQTSMFGKAAKASTEEIKQAKKLKAELAQIAKLRKSVGAGDLFGGRGSGGGRNIARAGAGPGFSAAVSGLAGMVGSAITAAVGFLVQATVSQIQRGYANYIAHGQARASLGGMGAPTKAQELGGQRWGFSRVQTLQHMRAVGRQTGNINAVNLAQGHSRSYGGDVDEMAGFMGTLTRAGSGFGGKAGSAGNRVLGKIMAHAFTSGLDKSRAGEHLTAVAQAVSSAQSVTGGKVDAGSISALLTLFSRSGQPGLQGAAGGAALGKIDSAVKRAGFGGGGDPATAMMYQAMGFGTPGGSENFYGATKRLQRGIHGEDGARNLQDIWSRFGAAGGGVGSENANLMLSRTTGLSLDQIEAINKVMAAHGGDTAAATQKIAEITAESLPTEDRILTANLQVAEHVADIENLMLTRGEAAAKDIERIEHAINDMVTTVMPEALTLLRAIAGATEWMAEILKRVHSGVASKVSSTISTGLDLPGDIVGGLQSQSMTKAEALAQLDEQLAEQRTAARNATGGGLGPAETVSFLAEQVTNALSGNSDLSGRQGQLALENISRLTGVRAGVQAGVDPEQLRALGSYYTLKDQVAAERRRVSSGVADDADRLEALQGRLERMEERLAPALSRIQGDTNNPLGSRGVPAASGTPSSGGDTRRTGGGR